MTKHAHPQLFPPVSIWWGSCDVLVLLSFTRRQFVSGSLVGCITFWNCTAFTFVAECKSRGLFKFFSSLYPKRPSDAWQI